MTWDSVFRRPTWDTSESVGKPLTAKEREAIAAPIPTSWNSYERLYEYKTSLLNRDVKPIKRANISKALVTPKSKSLLKSQPPKTAKSAGKATKKSRYPGAPRKGQFDTMSGERPQMIAPRVAGVFAGFLTASFIVCLLSMTGVITFTPGPAHVDSKADSSRRDAALASTSVTASFGIGDDELEHSEHETEKLMASP